MGAVCVARTAGAYCRTTTCDVDNTLESCTWDASGCTTSGHPLFWPDRCGWFGVQKDGSPKRHISYDTLHTYVVDAFEKWSQADCGGGKTPSFALADTDLLYGPVECAAHEFNSRGANASAWMFRDESWPYVGASVTIALTTVSVELSTGRIIDADVEINSYGTNITTSDSAVGADLDSIVTHESGHFLGLAHSDVTTATMFPSYSGISARSLDPDDESGICAAYPPAAAPVCGPPEPVYGFSRYCKGVNPSTLPASSGTDAGAPDGPPRPSSGGPNGDQSQKPSTSESGGCAIGHSESERAGEEPLGIVLAGIALIRRRARRGA